MPCSRCGGSCQGDRCAGCADIDRCEARHGDRVERDDSPDWQVEQTGLDGEAAGQTTLDGGIAKPQGGDDA